MNDIFIGGVVTGEKQHHRKRLRRIQFRWQPVVQLSVTRTKIFSICPDGDCVVEITAIVSLSLYTRAHSTRIYIYIYINFLAHFFFSPLLFASRYKAKQHHDKYRYGIFIALGIYRAVLSENKGIKKKKNEIAAISLLYFLMGYLRRKKS